MDVGPDGLEVEVDASADGAQTIAGEAAGEAAGTDDSDPEL